MVRVPRRTAPEARSAAEVAPPPIERKRSTRESQREQTRHRIYEAALAVFRRDGLVAARIDDIAAVAGVSHGSFYVHFPTKEAVLLERLAESEKRLVARLDSLPAKAPLPKVLRRLAEDMAGEWQSDAHLFAMVGLVALRTSAEMTGNQSHLVRRALIDRLRPLLPAPPRARGLPPAIMADVVLIGLFVAALSWAAAPDRLLREVLSDVVDLFVRGIERPVRS
ncbi:MAG: TetR/AcrR family transcriptional regulator [Myxococcales bacterium]|nr:TetR/AcrR family transcriptional regulator [Myxococcales bacterium]